LRFVVAALAAAAALTYEGLTCVLEAFTGFGQLRTSTTSPQHTAHPLGSGLPVLSHFVSVQPGGPFFIAYDVVADAAAAAAITATSSGRATELHIRVTAMNDMVTPIG
jgi:hypothetical protein